MKDNAFIALLNKRYHGAANIRGINYQLKYSLLKCFESMKNADFNSVRFEGIEDVDLVGMHAEHKFIQVKYSSKKWSWAKLREPLEGFYKCLKVKPDSDFLLIVNFELNSEMLNVMRFQSLSKKDRKRFVDKFVKLCKKFGANRQDAEALLDKVTIESLPEDRLWCDL